MRRRDVCALECVPDQPDAIGRLAAERALAEREEPREAEPLHPQPRDSLRGAREQREPHASALELGEDALRVLGRAPVRRVAEQLAVARLGALAPALVGRAAEDLL